MISMYASLAGTWVDIYQAIPRLFSKHAWCRRAQGCQLYVFYCAKGRHRHRNIRAAFASRPPYWNGNLRLSKVFVDRKRNEGSTYVRVLRKIADFVLGRHAHQGAHFGWSSSRRADGCLCFNPPKPFPYKDETCHRL